MPFPEQERNAMEAVLLFAMHQLDFDPASIRLFGWSIGGYPATWAGTQLPNIGGMVRLHYSNLLSVAWSDIGLIKFLSI